MYTFRLFLGYFFSTVSLYYEIIMHLTCAVKPRLSTAENKVLVWKVLEDIK